MSLLNDVLRDLDARRADAVASPDLQREIRPLPAPRERHAPPLLWLLFVIGMALAVLAMWWLTQVAPASVPKDGSVVAPVVSPALAKVAPVVVADSPAVPVQPAVPVSSEPQILSIPEPLLRSAVELQSLPAVPVGRSAPPVQAIGEAPKQQPAAVKEAQVPEKSAKAPVSQAPPENAVKPALAPLSGNSRSAVVEKNPVLTTPRERADAELHVAQALLAQGSATEALEKARLAMRHDAGFSPARQLALKILLDQNRREEAMRILQDGLEIQPGQIAWAMTLARLQLEANDAAAAERTLSRSWGPGAGSSAYAGFYGHVRSRLGQHREAAELYQTATRLAPGEGRWWFGLATALEQLGRQGEARAAYRQAHESGNLPPSLAAITEQRLGR